MKRVPIITYVETASTGHYPMWVQAIAEAFSATKPAYHLRVWVPKEFHKLHREWADQYFSESEHESTPVQFACYDSLFDPSQIENRRPSAHEIILRCCQADASCVCFTAT